jgi:hypothetical protein
MLTLGADGHDLDINDDHSTAKDRPSEGSTVSSVNMGSGPFLMPPTALPHQITSQRLPGVFGSVEIIVLHGEDFDELRVSFGQRLQVCRDRHPGILAFTVAVALAFQTLRKARGYTC